MSKYFCLLFTFFLFIQSLTPFEIYFKGFSGTTARRILKYDTNIGYDYLYHVRQNQHPHAYYSLYSSIFLFL